MTGFPPAEAGFPPADAGRPPQARLARIHLRVGLVSLARAELETMAGRGELDGASVADLAEARWRTGDLVGAGEAARAHLDGGGSDPVAIAVAAEAEAARGQLDEARLLAGRLTSRDDISAAALERLLGGRARAPIWSTMAELERLTPESTSPAPQRQPALPQRQPSAPEVERLAPEVEPSTPEVEPSTPEVEPSTPEVEPSTPEVERPTPVVERSAEAGGPAEVVDPGLVAARLGLELRQRGSSAEEILARADAHLAALSEADREGPAGAAIQLVRGDAFRQLGREEEARAAYRACWSAIEHSPALPEAPAQLELPVAPTRSGAEARPGPSSPSEEVP